MKIEKRKRHWLMYSQKKRNKRATTIIGDSIIKDKKNYAMRQVLPNERIYMKSFPGAIIGCMKDYIIKPSLKYDPNNIIIHVGTNDLRSTKTPMEIAEEIGNMAHDVKTEKNNVTISGITPRNDDLHIKGCKINDLLKPQ